MPLMICENRTHSSIASEMCKLITVNYHAIVTGFIRFTSRSRMTPIGHARRIRSETARHPTPLSIPQMCTLDTHRSCIEQVQLLAHRVLAVGDAPGGAGDAPYSNTCSGAE